MGIPIVYCMMTQNRLSEVKHCIQLVEPYVDKVVIVDGGSIDDSIFYLRNLAQESNGKIHFFLHPWTGHFSNQRTNYLNRAREVMGHDNFWVLVSDPDEWFEKETLENIQDLAQFCETSGLNMAAFQCRSVTLKGEKRVWESLDQYWKGLLFKYKPGIHYVGNPHESVAMPGGLLHCNVPFIYEHIKQENVIWHRGARNMYTGGGGPNLGTRNPNWLELKKLVLEVYGRDLSWHEFDAEMMRGELDPKIEGWIQRMRNETGYDGASEAREFFKLFYRIYHPELEPVSLRGTHIE